MAKHLIVIIVLLFTVSCSVNKMVVNSISDSMNNSKSLVFTGEEDPELVKDALPFMLKMQEIMIEQSPDNPKLYLIAGKSFIAYSRLFIQNAALMNYKDNFKIQEKQKKRAKKLYVRAVTYLEKGINLIHPKFSKKFKQISNDDYLGLFSKEDVPYMYWFSAGIMAALSVDPMDMKLVLDAPKAIKLIKKSLELDEGYEKGIIHETLSGIYGSIPPGMGGDAEKAKTHFKKAIELSEGKNGSPYVTLATTLCINSQDEKQFTELLNKVLEIDVGEYPENRLSNTISQKKAQWYLENKRDFFISESEETSDGDN